MISATARSGRWLASLTTTSILAFGACSDHGNASRDRGDESATAVDDDVVIEAVCDDALTRCTKLEDVTPADDDADATPATLTDETEAATPESGDSAPHEVTFADDWAPGSAVDQVGAWIGWVESTASVSGWWHGGDGNTSIQLADGRVWHFFADTYDGLVDPDFSRGSASNHLVHNSIVIRDADGLFLGQVWEGSGTPPDRAPAIRPDQDEHPDHFYWLPAGAVIEGESLRIFAALMQPDPLKRVDTHILTLDTDDGSVLDVTPTASESTLSVGIIGTFEYEGWHYIHGPRRSDEPFGDGWAMLRARAGRLRELDTWQAWDGLGWNDDPTSHAPLGLTDGGELPTMGIDDNAFRYSDNGFLALHKPLGNGMTVYRSDWPQGPYEPVGSLSTLTAEGDELMGGHIGSYAPRWHPHYDTDDGLVVSYATNYFSKPHVSDTERDNLYYMPNYAVIPQSMIDPLVDG